MPRSASCCYKLNDERPIRRLGVTRGALFEELESAQTSTRCPAQPYLLCRVAPPPGRPSTTMSSSRGHFLQAVPSPALPAAKSRCGLTPRALLRSFLKGERNRCSSACQRQPSAHHGARAHAVEPPTPMGRLDGRAHSPRGRYDRPSLTAALCELDPGAPARIPKQGFRACLGICAPWCGRSAPNRLEGRRHAGRSRSAR